jgi:hypothetical protein
MSRLRRLVLCDRYFFVTCKVLPQWERLSEADFAHYVILLLCCKTELPSSRMA